MIQLYLSYDVVNKYNTRTQELVLMVPNLLLLLLFQIFSVFSTITVTRSQVVVELMQFTLKHDMLVCVFLNMFHVPTF